MIRHLDQSKDKPLRIAIVVDPRWAYGRRVIRGAIQYLKEKPDNIHLDLFSGQPFSKTSQLSEYDGILEGSSDALLEHLPENCPSVSIDAIGRQSRSCSIPIDHRGMGTIAADTLHSRGVVSYAYFDGGRNLSAESDTRSTLRREGFKKRLQELGIELSSPNFQTHSHNTFNDLLKWLQDLPKPTGIFAYSDSASLELAEACRMLDLLIPREVAIIGAGNDTILCSLLHPALSSVDTQTETITYQAMHTLIGLIRGDSATLSNTTPPQPQAVLRESTGQSSTPNKTVSKALDIIYSDEDRAERTTAQDIALATGVSLRSLQRLFKQHLETTVQQALLDARIERFKYYLRTTDLPIEELSTRLHIDCSSLRKSFTRITGHSPGHYRSLFKKGAAHNHRKINGAINPKVLTIGFLSPLSGQADLDALRGAEEYARQHRDIRLALRAFWNYPTDASSTYSSDGESASLENYDAFIVTTEVQLPAKLIGKKPIIYLDHTRRHSLAWSIGIDNWDIGALAAQHFLSKGYRHFAFCDYPRYNVETDHTLIDYRFSGRFAGFQDTLTKAGVPIHEIRRGYNSEDEPLLVWLKNLPRKTALFTFNDALAVRVARLCAQANLEIPNDIALLGVDNDESLCPFVPPGLSSVDIGFDRLGHMAIKNLINILKNPNSASALTFSQQACSVVERSSTQGLATDDPALNAASRFITHHIAEPLNVNEIVSVSDVSRRTLETRFTKVTGHTIHEHLQQKRLEAATNLLTRTADSVDHIAESCGFKHTRHFCQRFKQSTGQTPLAFRKSRGRPLLQKLSPECL
ncbi:substrate-binding domain-containing protein [Rubellicoccus peritrichatus]|uniref:Substrate-binding domain-containing protein n=1 Tax=Rubellicoccus peritrichatus TaxID=3080537 RepID=A0AAQ3LF82_9BACT|nr:substrate-binding domain-containing protein [Puniceicoccus sp. CR14]WOO40864.1 substrate-binding domain-containing protein [Puniceicoccus sp. CR14]